MKEDSYGNKEAATETFTPLMNRQPSAFNTENRLVLGFHGEQCMDVGIVLCSLTNN